MKKIIDFFLFEMLCICLIGLTEWGKIGSRLLVVHEGKSEALHPPMASRGRGWGTRLGRVDVAGGIIVTDGSIPDNGPDAVSVSTSSTSAWGVSATLSAGGVSASVWAASSAAGWSSGGALYGVWGRTRGLFRGAFWLVAFTKLW